RRLPPVVHVAGTNGKGSTLAFLRAVLEAAGHRVHVYTSPHLVRFHERIRLAGRLIDEAALLGLLEDCERANGDAPITFFEVTTAAAFKAFAETPADVVLLETGLGGRLDATNVVPDPAVCAITRISMDHMQFLGDSLEAIAGEKAGIFKPGRPCIVAPQPAAAVTDTLRARAAAVGAPLAEAPRDWRVAETADGFAFESNGRSLALPRPALPGRHQLDNAGTALACLPHIPLAVDDGAIRRGLLAAEWPARLQRLGRGPLAEALPPGCQLWLDGGHNDSAGEVLAEQARRWAAADGLPLRLVYAMLSTKRPEDFLSPLAPHLDAVRTVAIPGDHASLGAAELAALVRSAGIAGAAPAADVAEAVRDLAAVGPCRVLIVGSLYLAGTVLAENG
ncbi:MAG TPA: folylpolyglutamate synthase/dihydrofolate synthase family protein, partial [Alphaproteobacteria bacterium]|nr:folylpolyglutamate synthase/dihydrofolate synthase family protein [Alphaproteobacteria bacterium]